MNNLAHNALRASAALAIVGLTASMTVFNVRQWWADGLHILAILAAFFEVIGCVFAVMTEAAIREKRYDRAAVCGLILLGSAAFNTVGGERAWAGAMHARIDADRQAAQSALDKTRSEVSLTLASARAEIAAYSHLLPAADAPTMRQRGMMQAWEMATADARQRGAQAQQRLDRLPIVAEVAPPFPAWLVYAFLAFVELVKVAGLWSLGFVTAHAAANVVNINHGRELVAKRWAKRATA